MGNSVLQKLAARAPIMKTVSLPRGRHRLHAMPTTTGYEIRTSASYDWSGRRRGQTPFTVLQHTISGAGNLQYERRRYRLRAGDTMLTIVPHNHRYWLEEGGRWEFFWISMSGQEAVRVHRVIQATAGPVLRLKPETIEHLASCSLRLIEGEGETPGTASAIAYEVAMTLYDAVFPSSGASASDDEDDPIRPVVDHIRTNLDKPLAVSELAEIAGSRGVRAERANAPRRPASDQSRAAPRQGDRNPLRLRRAELFRESFSPLFRRQPDRVSHDGNVASDRPRGGEGRDLSGLSCVRTLWLSNRT
jgi:hypothetical protein